MNYDIQFSDKKCDQDSNMKKSFLIIAEEKPAEKVKNIA